ncbi:hypothetical protein M8J77_005177 [Diaphorina citri]|nr:hypothetical protein M8J77_005177 [Diaphorina citri]
MDQARLEEVRATMEQFQCGLDRAVAATSANPQVTSYWLREDIELVKSARNLFIYFDDTLSWTVNNNRKKVYGALWTLGRLKTYLLLNTKKLLTKFYVLPLFEYCAPLLLGVTQEESNRIQLAQNACVRFIFKVRRREHITPYYNRLQLLKVEERRKLLTLFQTYKSSPLNPPPYLFEKYRFRSNVRERFTRTHELFLDPPAFRTEAYHNSFLISSVTLWNSIPYSILQCRSFFAFKTLLTEAVGNKTIRL